MRKLVWMEFINTVYGRTKSQTGTVVVTILKTVLFLWMFLVACGAETANAMIFIGIMLIGSYLESSVPDVVHMIPGTIEKYLYARLEMVITLQFGVLTVVQVVRMLLHVSGLRQWILYEELAVFLSYSVFIVLRSVWKFYGQYTYQPFYQEKGAGFVALMGFIFTAGLGASSEENDMVINGLRLCVFLAYAGYTVYICRFVKKNVLLTAYYGGENT